MKKKFKNGEILLFAFLIATYKIYRILFSIYYLNMNFNLYNPYKVIIFKNIY